MKGIRHLTPYNLYSQTLNQTFWGGKNKLKSNISDYLLEMSETVLKDLGINKGLVKDIILTGSQAGFSSNVTSDIDIHFKIHNADHYNEKVKRWNMNHDARIFSVPVEFYFEDINSGYPACQGRYSLVTKKWIQRPCPVKPVEHTLEFQLKLKYFITKIMTITSGEAPMFAVRRLKTQLKSMRSGGLSSKEGEQSIDNRIYKELRRLGYLQKLHDLL